MSTHRGRLALLLAALLVTACDRFIVSIYSERESTPKVGAAAPPAARQVTSVPEGAARSVSEDAAYKARYGPAKPEEEPAGSVRSKAGVVQPTGVQRRTY